MTFAAKFSCVTKKFEEFSVTYKGTFLLTKFTVSENVRKYNTMQQSVRKRKRNVIGMPQNCRRDYTFLKTERGGLIAEEVMVYL